jgi:dsDNA-specific endonuclease/ATPase MutS2
MGRSKKHPVPEELADGVIITDTLDLHGLFPEQIHDIVHAFIENAVDLKLKRLKLIHGKGRSRLKWEALQILKTHQQVCRYYDAPLPEGGWGVTIIELIES